MIKLTHIKATIKTKNYIIMIPGGPGLSSTTIRSLDILKNSSHLLYVDLQGTNGTQYHKDLTYKDLIKNLSEEINKIISKDNRLFLLGHSFGGFIAASLACELKADGLFCLATPFTNKSLKTASENYDLKKSVMLIKAEESWLKNNDNDSFKKWLSEYGEMYFLNPRGKEMILEDKASSQFFNSNRSDATQFEPLLEKVAKLKILKVFIVGNQDGLLSMEELEKDALKDGFQFFSIEGASHFMTFDQPEKLAVLINSKITL